MNKPKHPIQPVVVGHDRIVRFKENRIVNWMLHMLRRHDIDLNTISLTFDIEGDRKDDYQQLMQLIGYSVSGYGDLSCHDEDVLREAERQQNERIVNEKAK